MREKNRVVCASVMHTCVSARVRGRAGVKRAVCATEGRREVRGRQTGWWTEGLSHPSFTPPLWKARHFEVPYSLLLGEGCLTSWQQPVITEHPDP